MSDESTNPTAAGGATALPYGTTRRRRVGAFGLTGLAFAVVGAVLAAMICWATARDLRVNVRIDVNLSPSYFLFPAVGLILCAIGLVRREKRLLPALGIVISLAAVSAVVLLGSRVWGRPAPGGASPWHLPRFG
jgi:hypothetical protein